MVPLEFSNWLRRRLLEIGSMIFLRIGFESVRKMSINISVDKKETYDSQAVNNFREYLRIPSVQPDINYDECVEFLRKQAKNIGLVFKVFTPVPKRPIVIITWEGTNPKSPSILLNSHMDVVPVFEDKWTHPPFSAHMDDQGRIYARGSQDMKCVGIQYLEAIRRLKESGVRFKKTIHCSFVPDEEIGGKLGMMKFVKTQDFKDLNVGCGLDEGIASATEEFVLSYAERCIWHVNFHCPGQPGHGSILHENTAGEKVAIIMQRIYELREKEKKKLKNDPKLTLGDVLTLNVTILKGGVQNNVLPPEFIISMDCRIPVTMNLKDLEATFQGWCKEAGDGVFIEKEQDDPMVAPTKLDNSNPYWVAFKHTADKLGLKLKPQVFIGGTDIRFVRELGVPSFGFSPMNNTPVLLHDHDEFLSKDVFLKGIDIYCALLPALANIDNNNADVANNNMLGDAPQCKR